MSQNDLSIANQGFASFRSDLNSALQALGSTNSGTSAPSTTYANQLFYDTTNNILKIRNEDNDAFISLFTLDQANDNIESLTINGALTADSLAVDNITIDGTEIDLSSGDLTLDVAGDIILDADGGDFQFKDGGTHVLNIENSSGDIKITSITNDKDIIFRGVDNSSAIEAMRIDMSEGGNVGIGTSSPTSNYGTNLNVHSSATDGAALHLTDGTTGNTTTDGFHLISTGGSAFVWNRESNNMVFATNNTERMRIDSSGRVLIGTTSEYSGTPAELIVDSSIDIGNGSSSDNAVLAFAKNATTGTIGSVQSKIAGFSTMPKINIVASNVGGGSQTGEIEFYTTLNASQTLKFKIDGNGDLKGVDTSIGSLSDERLKEDIKDFTYDLEKFKKLETKSFKWKNPTQHGGKSDTVYGTIAQQIELVDADFVSDDLLKATLDNNGTEETNPDYTLTKDTNGIAKVSKVTGKKDAMFISVIQQLISKIEILETKVTALESK